MGTKDGAAKTRGPPAWARAPRTALRTARRTCPCASCSALGRARGSTSPTLTTLPQIRPLTRNVESPVRVSRTAQIDLACSRYSPSSSLFLSFRHTCAASSSSAKFLLRQCLKKAFISSSSCDGTEKPSRVPSIGPPKRVR